MLFVWATTIQLTQRSKTMIALTVVAVAVTAIAFIFCTTVGVKMVMDDAPGMGLCNIAMGVGNLLLCICNIARLVGQSAGA